MIMNSYIIFQIAGNGVRTQTTTFSTGNGGTVHITRTVIGGDGSVRREMRFRTPTSEDHAAAANDGGSFTSSGPSSTGPTQNTSSTANLQEPTSASKTQSRDRNHQARPTARVTPTSSHPKSDSNNSIPASTRSKSARTRRDDPQQRTNPTSSTMKEAESTTRGQPDGAIDPNSSTAPFVVPSSSTTRQKK